MLRGMTTNNYGGKMIDEPCVQHSLNTVIECNV